MNDDIKKNNQDVKKNRETLINMLAITEDITRTNNRLYTLLSNVMHNPSAPSNLEQSVRDLTTKIGTLDEKLKELGTDFIIQEDVVVPSADDASPKVDEDFEGLIDETDESKDEELFLNNRKIEEDIVKNEEIKKITKVKEPTTKKEVPKEKNINPKQQPITKRKPTTKREPQKPIVNRSIEEVNKKAKDRLDSIKKKAEDTIKEKKKSFDLGGETKSEQEFFEPVNEGEEGAQIEKTKKRGPFGSKKFPKPFGNSKN